MAKRLRSLNGQVVAITGGARGIGRATAAALIAQGARVGIGDIDAPLAEKTATELGGGTIGLPLDVTDRTSFTAFLDEVERQLGPLDVLVNNAGIMPIGPFVEETDARRAADDRRQRPRRDPRLEAGHPALRATRARATSSSSPRSPARAGFPGGPPIAPPSTRWSG